MVYLMKHIASDRWTPLIAYTPDGRYRMPCSVADLLAGKFDPQFDKPDCPMMIDLRWGQRVPDELVWRVPTRIYHVGKRRWKAMPDTLGDSGQWIISQRLYEIVEQIDPGIHQFFPVEIIYQKSGQPYTEGGPFRYWNILRSATMMELLDINHMRTVGKLGNSDKIEKQVFVDDMRLREYYIKKTQGLVEEIEVKFTNGSICRSVRIIASPEDCIVRHDSFKGTNALWSVREQTHNTNYMMLNDCFITDKLHDAFVKNKINSIEYQRTKEKH